MLYRFSPFATPSTETPCFIEVVNKAVVAKSFREQNSSQQNALQNSE